MQGVNCNLQRQQQQQQKKIGVLSEYTGFNNYYKIIIDNHALVPKFSHIWHTWENTKKTLKTLRPFFMDGGQLP